MSVTGIWTSSVHEHDERWDAVDKYTLDNLHPESRPNHAILSKTLTNSRDKGLPDIAANPVMGKFLALQCKALGVTHALEVGTLGAYAAIWMASENPRLKVTTIEYNPEHAKVARENIEAAGLSDRIQVYVGAGLDVLPEIEKEVAEGKKEKIGFCWIDADKTNNLKYFNYALKLGKKGTCICVDNVVRQGKLVIAAGSGDAGVQGARELVETLGKDDRVDAVVMQTVADKSYDGFLMAVVN